MVILRSFKILFRNPNSRSFVNPRASTTLLSSQSHPLPSIFSSTCSPASSNPFLRTSSHSRFLSPFSRWIPFSGPLFLSSPPCLLLQSATPFYLQGDIAFKQVEPLNPKFLRKRTFPEVVNWIDNKELRNGGEVSGEPSERFFNLPNLISMSRLVSGPFIGWMIINDWYLSAFLGLALSGATDWLDGYVARRMGINSVVGSYLDPLADKVLIGCVALAMVKKDLLHSWLVGLVVLRDVGLVSGAVYQRAYSLDWKWKSWSEFTNLNENRPQRVEPLYLSKINTVFQLVLVAAALLQPELGTDDTQVYITYMSWLVASTTVASTLAYGVKYIKNGSRLPTTCK